MERILVVCGAGASSTFLTHWMRTVAAQRAEHFVVVAMSAARVGAEVAEADIVLVGHHLEPEFDLIATAAREVGAVASLLPPLTFDGAGAATALAMARYSSGHRTEPAHPTRPHHREPENIHG